ncbi:chronophin isoform X1 [Acipenser ruthenus]|uniref:chronophin isoform X1 n=1 Tax=Acipenser ruthenus TaxID=7906 RepID=UPI00155FCE45|nr:chronophin isoform X1 [Acipenser ruthenus]
MAGALSRRGCIKIRGPQLRELLDSKCNILFDCDGVIWEGEKAIPGAIEVVSLLKNQGKNVFFVTNNCTRPRDSYMQKFTRLGFTDVQKRDIFSSAYCSAVYLRDFANLQGKVFVIGGDGVYKELREAGVPFVESEPETPGMTISDCPLHSDVKAVLVAYDEDFNFLKLAKACCYLRDSECLFIASDPDPWHPVRGGRVTPGSGSLTAALETATNRKATVMGKPSRFMFECITSQCGADAAQSLMVGDRLETDILFGANCGLSTVLTLTGVSTIEEAQANLESDSPAKQNAVPDYVVDSIGPTVINEKLAAGSHLVDETGNVKGSINSKEPAPMEKPNIEDRSSEYVVQFFNDVDGHKSQRKNKQLTKRAARVEYWFINSVDQYD